MWWIFRVSRISALLFYSTFSGELQLAEMVIFSGTLKNRSNASKTNMLNDYRIERIKLYNRNVSCPMTVLRYSSTEIIKNKLPIKVQIVL